jgi:uncharacterized membrane protein YbhN (UPF0104 family)
MVRAVPLPKSRKAILRRILEITVTAAFLGFIVWSLAGRWSEVRAVIGDLALPALGLSTLAAMAATWCSFLAWKALLADFGSSVPITGGMRIFFVGQLGKYLPGKVWPIVTQARLGREYRVPGRASAAAVLLTMLITLGTGLLLTAVSLPFLGAGAFDSYWWTLLALPLAGVALWPGVLNWGLGHAMRLARREPMPRPLSFGGIGRSVAWSVATWCCYGIHLWVLLLDLGGDGGASLLIPSTGAFAASWTIGFVLSVAPAGLGPREAALSTLLGSAVDPAVALVAAVVSRLLMTIADLAWPAVALLAARRRPGSETGEPDEPGLADPAIEEQRSVAG